MRKKWFMTVAMLLVMAVGISGCSPIFGKKHTEIKHYEETTKKPSATSSQKEEGEKVEKISWEDAMDMAAGYLKKMTVEEKVGQLFIVNLEQLDQRKGNYYEFRKYTREMEKNIEKYQVGGVILFSRNIAKRTQTIGLTSGLQSAGKIPLFITVDEEGGDVARIASNDKMQTTKFPSPEEIGKTKDDQYVYDMAKTIGTEIKELGFNVDFAPVADVKTSELNAEIGNRSFGNDPDKVSEYVSAFVQGLDRENISGTLKHFPGQGSSKGDTHKENVDIDSSIARLRKTDFVPFEAGIEAGADFVMVSHISVSKVTESATPASMSKLIMQTILREELGFERIIITDAFDMSSITDNYTSAEAAYNAFKGGADIILMPDDFQAAYTEILNKVKEGKITIERLDDSVVRILAVKIQRGLLTQEQLTATPEPTKAPTVSPAKQTGKKDKKAKTHKKKSKKKSKKKNTKANTGK